MNKFKFTLVLLIICIMLGGACAIQTAETPTPSPTEVSAIPTITPTASQVTPTPIPETTPAITYGDGEPLVSLPDFTPVVNKVAPAVVLITTEVTSYNLFLQPIPQEGAGTGVIFDPRGYIVTNNHVVENAKNIKVTLADGRTFDINQKDVRTDVWTDLAVIKIEGGNFPVARFADPDTIYTYQWVLAIGYPFKLKGGPTVTAGIISATGRSIQEENGIVLYDLIQPSAAINPGNSGGPLVNMAGEVVGINTAIIYMSQNIGFTISAETVIPVIESLVERGYVIRPFLGVSMQTVNPLVAMQRKLATEEGVLILKVVPASPAEEAGLEANDVVTHFAREKVTTTEEMRQAIIFHNIGDVVEVTFMRGDTLQTVTVRLGETTPP